MDAGVVILVFILSILFMVLIFYLISRSKGKITINLNKYEFSPGEEIIGTINLRLKKPLQAKKLSVGLEAISKGVSYTGRSISSRTQRVFNFEKPIIGERIYPEGNSTYNFKISIPLNTNQDREGVAGKLIKSIQILSGVNSQINWYLRASLDIQGFNITKKVRINVI